MNKKVIAIPFVKILPFLILGIIIEESTKVNSLLLCLILSSLFLTIFLLPRYRSTSLIFPLCALLLISCGLLRSRSDRAPFYILNDQLPKIKELRGEIYKPKPASKNIRYHFRIESIHTDHSRIDLNFDCNILLYLDKNVIGEDFGSKRIKIHKPTVYQNLQTDNHFSKWMKRNKLVGSVWADEATVELIEGQKLNKLEGYRLLLRDHIHILFPQESTRAIAKALLIGDKTSITKELRDIYTKSGAIHILTVSGLHATIIFSIPFFLLGKIGLAENSKYTISLFSVYAFTILCGAAPSLLRASLMISLFALAKRVGKKSEGFNILLACACILILYDPNIIYNISFQLSFSAVYGIMAFFKRYQKIWQPKYKLLQYSRDMLAVSLAAQTGTLGFSLFHFHQFPLAFLLSTLLVIPLAPIVIVLLLVSLSLSFISLEIGTLPAEVVSHILNFQNILLGYISNQPGLHLKDIPFSNTDLILYYTVLISINLNKKLLSWSTMTCILVFFSVSLLTENKLLKQHALQLKKNKGKYELRRTLCGESATFEIEQPFEQHIYFEKVVYCIGE